MEHKVFISYSHADKLVVENIHNFLIETGVPSFRDEKNIGWGDKITLSVNDELMSCNTFLVVLSPASIKSSWVMLELGQALAMNKKILPYLTHSSLDIPDLLRDTKNISDLESLKKYFTELEEINKTKSFAQKSFIAPPEIELELDYIVTLKRSNILEMKSPVANVFSSFEPLGSDGKFLQLSVLTTKGLVPERTANNEIEYVEQENIIDLVCDPIRPFEIQIGKTRTRRPRGDLEGMMLTDEYGLEKIRQLYPAIIDDDHKWMRVVIAELSSSEDMLDYIYKFDPDPLIKELATKNPYASESLKSAECSFCKSKFLDDRVIFEYESALIFPNDYPYGPYFHYIVLPSEPVHSWQNITEKHLVDMNIAIKRLFQSDYGERALGGTVGVRIGLNSSIRHLVMGKATSTAAGATVPHIHKQVWGMAISSFNLGDHLCMLCDAYEGEGIDYLSSYLSAIRKNEFLIWEDGNVALYIPYGQISIHELQIMVKRIGAYTYLDLTEDEIRSLSKAEFIVTRIYFELGINSFNEVLMTKTFYRDAGRNFRLILTFMTREVDLAVSELNLVYVVDKHPTDTRNEIRKIWPTIYKNHDVVGSSAVQPLSS